MKIKRVECEQFAGLQNKEVEFRDGLNLVIGDNESGKSTVVDLIYQLLFKDVKLDRRSDQDFINRYFPKKVNGQQGDVIDGILVFHTDKGAYRLRKEWEQGEGSCRITLPDGTSIKNNASINEILKEELKYRSGVFNEIIFASQKRQQMAVESIMGEYSKKREDLSGTRDDLALTLTRAALETGGVSLEVLEKKLSEKIASLEDHWDISADLPDGGVRRGINNPWKREVGRILEAYYDMETVRKAQADAENAEKDVENLKLKRNRLLKRREDQSQELGNFQHYRSILGQIKVHKQRVVELKQKISTYDNVLRKWPEDRANRKKACNLKEQLEQAAIRALYQKAKAAQEELKMAEKNLAEWKEVDLADITRLEDLQYRKDNNERKLAGLNLVARVRKLGIEPVEIRSAATGRMLEPIDGEIRIEEAVEITIPGIMEMQLMPQGIDLDEIKVQLKADAEEIDQLLGKYQAGDLKELKVMQKSRQDAENDLRLKQSEAERICRDKSWEEIRQENDRIPSDIPSENEIRSQITDLCGRESIEAYIGGQDRILKEYQSLYQSEEKLETSLQESTAELECSQDALTKAEDIPEEYRNVEDPERYDQELRDGLKDTEADIDAVRKELNEAEKKLGEKSAEEYSEELQEKQSRWEARKEELVRWKKIEYVLTRMKEEMDDHPMDDIEKNFRAYLDVITSGGLELLSIDEQMSVKLASRDHALTYDILSEGTKETISLAFRLAMLDHLYPEGGGLAVFDDPFTEMDPTRTAQACRLIEKFAERNQVIFVTCDEKYRQLMTGNIIFMSE